MATLVYDCGFCRARTQTGDIVSHEAGATVHGVQRYIVGVKCRRCGMISCLVTYYKGAGRAPAREDADITSALQIIDQHPRLSDPTAPAHVPDIVAKAFVQAEKQVDDKSMSESAAVMYRRTVEQAMRSVAESRGVTLAGRNLKEKIDSAAQQGLVPHDLAAWAHEVRDIGNEGAHGDSVEQGELKELRGFVDLLLRYLFTLPGVLEERRLSQLPLPDTL